MLTKPFRLLALAGAATSVALGGCVTTPPVGANGLYATPILAAPVTSNPTPYSSALVCLAQYARSYGLASPRIAIGRIDDKTGKAEADGSGRQITLGASEMAVSAFAKAGANLVERYDTSVSEMELKYANNKLITDGGATPGEANDYRRIYSGQVAGSDFYIVGAITEVNANIYSSGADLYLADPVATGAKARIGGRVYVMNVAMDLRVVDTISQQIVDVISYQKQLVAREVGSGVFDMLDGNLFDLSAGNGGREPMQLAVRSLIERATVEVMANFYGMPGPDACVRNDPLGAVRTAGVTGAYVPAYDNLETNNAQSREDPNRWNADRDADVPDPRGYGG